MLKRGSFVLLCRDAPRRQIFARYCRRRNARKDIVSCTCGSSDGYPFQVVIQPTSERSYPGPLRLRYDRFKGQCDIGVCQKLSLSL